LLDPELKIINLDQFEETIVLVEQFDTASYDYNISWAEDGSGWVIVDAETLIEKPVNSSLTLRQGNTVTFNVNSQGRPFYIVDTLEPQNTSTSEYTLEYTEAYSEIGYNDVDQPGEINPSFTVQTYSTLSIIINSPGYPITIVEEDYLGNRVPITENITNNGTDVGTISWTPEGGFDKNYYYQLTSDPSISGEIFVVEYFGTFYNENYEVPQVQNNGSFNGQISWTLSSSPAQKYYYVDQFGPYYGEIDVLTNNPIFVPQVTTSYKEYLIPNVDTISYQYYTDSEGIRLLQKNLPSWLFNTKLGDDAWLENNFTHANLFVGDEIQIDGESDYREILYVPNSVNTRNYNPGKYISNEIYSKVKATNYEGLTRGEGLSLTANVDFVTGSVSSLNVSDIEFNKRDLQLYFEKGVLLQPTAYQYYTTPKVYFIPVDGNGGGAKAEVIAYGGQILDIVLVDGGSGYTQPPKVVVARGYNRIKKSERKIDSLSYLEISPYIAGFELTTSSLISTQKLGLDPQGFEIVVVNTIDSENTDRDITSIITPKIYSVSILSENRSQEITKFLVYDNLKFDSFRYNSVEIVSVITAPLDIVSIVSVENTDRQITREINKVINNAIIEIPSEAINDIGAFLDAPMTETDTIVYIPDTRRFPDASRLLIGKEIVRYARKLTDRFLDVERGTNGTTAITHNAGDYLRHLPEFIAIVPVGPTTIFTTEVTSTIITQPTSIIQSISSIINCDSVQNVDKEFDNQYQIEVYNTDVVVVPVGLTTSFTTKVTSSTVTQPTTIIQLISDIINCDSVQNVDKEFDNQYQIEIDNTDVDVIKEVIIIPPTSFNIVTNIYSTQSYVSVINEAGILNVTNTIDIQMSADTDKEITTVQSITLELDVISSSSITTELDYSFSSVSSVISTSIITSDRLVTNLVNINVDNTNLVESSNITILAANALSVVSTLTTILTDPISREIKLDHNLYANNTYIQTSNSITTQLDVPLAVYTLSNLLSSKLAKNADVTRFYKTGVLDYYEEAILLVNPILTRTGIVVLDGPINNILLRDNSTIDVTNKSIMKEDFYDSYYPINAGFNLRTFENNIFVDTGLLSNSTSIEELSLAYPLLTIDDFTQRPESAITLNGETFNLALSTIQNPVVYSVGTNLSSSSIVQVIGNISKYPSSGYIFQGSSTQYSVIQYSGKTSNSFTGCILITGSNIIDSGNDIIPYSV